MSRELHGRPSPFRAALVWLAVTALPLLALPRLLVPLDRLPSASAKTATFADLLVAGCGVLLSLSLVWAWAQVTAVLLCLLREREPGPGGCPAVLRRAVLAACGVAVVAGGPAAAAESSLDPAVPGRAVVAGLPLPERPVVVLPTGRPGGTSAARVADRPLLAPLDVVRVRPGDSLWTIARRRLGDAATDAQVDRAWRAIWQANREAIGADPDVLHPGTVLHPAAPAVGGRR